MRPLKLKYLLENWNFRYYVPDSALDLDGRNRHPMDKLLALRHQARKDLEAGRDPRTVGRETKVRSDRLKGPRRAPGVVPDDEIARRITRRLKNTPK